ncbi:uncharacterized protein BO87DRAFT_401472 [Aspergillus neoniger CBS 115656]|uniref:3'-5' exonuclease domain-containing protein n=1 Tax=Aspergillus neoniger (strain CBS 115656) TaxID=1448310 RepID=A0A318Y9D4_ASPNB|nr:hypothetical protein BO87DRAFT_401472 [Aspergillus neoniger CBS 115656]PYH29290.1 hypothetical protein BO87DRAFT_401472 [Aspergillus neoniger CBS 115656]
MLSGLVQVSVSIIDSHDGLCEVIDALMNSPVTPPSIYIDLEGINLGRDGRISIIQLFLYPQHHVHLIDVHTLGATAFNHATNTGTTLRSILELFMMPKVFFDVPNDSAAMFHQHQAELAGVHDLQVMEVGTRAHPGKYLAGLGKCISRDIEKTLFSPQHGGSFEVFELRPLPEAIVQYCVQDVLLLPKLWHIYNPALTPASREKVEAEVKNRFRHSQSPRFIGKGSHMVLAPQLWETAPECPSSWL